MDAEQSATREIFEFQDAAMIANDFGDQWQAEARARMLCRNEGLEDMRRDVIADTWAIVLDLDGDW